MQTNNDKVSSLPAKADKVSRVKNQVASEYNTLVSDAEELLKSTAAYSGETVNAARVRIQDSLDRVRNRIADAQTAATERLNEAAKVTDTYVHDNPWKVMGIAALVGVVLGILMNRK